MEQEEPTVGRRFRERAGRRGVARHVRAQYAAPKPVPVPGPGGAAPTRRNDPPVAGERLRPFPLGSGAYDGDPARRVEDALAQPAPEDLAGDHGRRLTEEPFAGRRIPAHVAASQRVRLGPQSDVFAEELVDELNGRHIEDQARAGGAIAVV